MSSEGNEKELWLMKLAHEYDGVLPYRSESEVLEWLKDRAAETEDREERKRYRELIEEAEDFGGSDDWGQISGELVKFARFLELLRFRSE